MNAELIEQVPPERRDALYAEICRITRETDAVNRALEPVEEALDADEALAEIADLIGAEIRKARRKSRRVVAAA